MSSPIGNDIIFTVNGKKQTVSNNIDYRDSLNDYIRERLNLRGTKVMCREGGCGVCIVNVKETHPITNEKISYGINSCLVSPLSCHGKDITTIEGIGNQIDGYHPVQSRLADFNGSQCGFCSPGWVMNMYSILQGANKKITMQEIEDSFAGNICRCTGYRPIADAMKSFAINASYDLRRQIKDIEDMDKFDLCGKTGELCMKSCDDYDEENDYCIIDMKKAAVGANKDIITVNFQSHKWIKVYTLVQLSNVFKTEGTASYRLIAGNTGKGVYEITEYPKLLIDISQVEELRRHSLGTNLVLGGGMSLNEVISVFKNVSTINDYFSYTQILNHHLQLVAHTPVRNIGTIAGNLSLKHDHPEFPSDIFLILETVGSVITLLDAGLVKTTMSLTKYLQTNMTGKVILSVELPPLSKSLILQTYKIMPRAQNAHAIVNAGFLLKLKSETSPIIESARIVFGNINESFVHAVNTEKFLIGKTIYNTTTLQLAIRSLSKEVNPNYAPPEPSPDYRKNLALGLFYKFILHITPQRLVSPKFLSGGTLLSRGLSHGKQVFDTKPAEYPLNKPIIKIEANHQCAGEAKYINDLTSMFGEVHATFILSTVHNGILKSIDASEALKLDGVVGFFTAKDIPGDNCFTPLTLPFSTAREEFLVAIGNRVKHHHQPIAVIVAENVHVLTEAAALVKSSYTDVTTKPILTINDAINAPNKSDLIVKEQYIDAISHGTNTTKILKGTFDVHSQYHFYMETQTTICIPNEDSMEVIAATQSMDHVNASVAGMLKVQENSINVTIRRLGAAYGGKISRASQIACGCALAARKLNRPVRFVLPFKANMQAIGKKHETFAEYEVGVNDSGVIQYLIITIYHNNGCSHNESIASVFTVPAFKNCYKVSSWTITANNVLTELPSNTFFRAPGACDGLAMIENIMDHIALETGVDPIKVRIANMDTTDNPLPGLIEEHTKKCDYYTRLNAVKEYNANNRWKKKGIGLTDMKFNLVYVANYNVDISIYHSDGSVSVTHGGIEMGQGINTKVAQVVAHTLNIPLCDISIKPSRNVVTPNQFSSAGSVTSELCCYAAVKACDILNDRLNEARSALDNPTWLEAVTAAYTAGYDLNASYMYSGNDPISQYPVHGVCITEVEVDILTGRHEILRVEILEDVGESINPFIDVGQIEGAFMTGVGFWTCEHLEYDKITGELLTDSTWTYKVPTIKDIPIDLRVYFRRNSPNPLGVLRSKATGEPALTMAFSVASALRMAISSARSDAGMDCTWFNLKYPLTAENICKHAGTDPSKFKLNPSA